MTRSLFYVSLMVLISCSGSNDATPASTEAAATDGSGQLILSSEQMNAAGITVGKATIRSIADVVVVNGLVDVPPQRIISVSFPLGGYLKRTDMLPGMRVRKGQVIAYMEDQQIVQLQEDYLVGKERLAYLEQEFARQKSLNEHQVNAAKVFQQASAEVNSQRVRVRAMEEKLRLINIDPEKLSSSSISRSVPIFAGINGYVSKVLVNIGKYVQPADVLFELIDPDDLHAALTIFQKDVPKVAVGQEVSISFVNEPEKVYPGKVILANQNLDENRSSIIHCHFVQHPSSLLPGMFLKASIRTAPREALTVPEQALVVFQGKTYLFTSLMEDRFQMTAVETGIRENGYVEVKNPADFQNAKIIITNAHQALGALKNEAE